MMFAARNIQWAYLLSRKNMNMFWETQQKLCKGQNFFASCCHQLCSCSRAARYAAAASQLPTFAKLQKKKALQNRAESLLRSFEPHVQLCSLEKKSVFVLLSCTLFYIFKCQTWNLNYNELFLPVCPNKRSFSQRKRKSSNDFWSFEKNNTVRRLSAYHCAQTGWNVWRRGERREKGAWGETVWWLLLSCERFPLPLPCEHTLHTLMISDYWLLLPEVLPCFCFLQLVWALICWFALALFTWGFVFVY